MAWISYCSASGVCAQEPAGGENGLKRHTVAMETMYTEVARWVSGVLTLQGNNKMWQMQLLAIDLKC